MNDWYIHVRKRAIEENIRGKKLQNLFQIWVYEGIQVGASKAGLYKNFINEKDVLKVPEIMTVEWSSQTLMMDLFFL